VLDWNITGIENYKEKCWIECTREEADAVSGGFFSRPTCERDGKYSMLRRSTYALIVMSMGFGIASVTEKNVDKVFGRINFMERLKGTYFNNEDGSPLFMTLEEVKENIGFRTNVSEKTKSQFLKDLTYDWSL